MHKLYIRRAVCVLTVLALCVGCMGILTCAEDQKEAKDEIHIQSADDLVSLAEHCRWDTWSKNLEVTLDNDISLSGMEFSPIRFFDGTFRGNGHTISGLNLTGSDSPCGLFAEIGENGTVEKLHVQGDLAPSGSGDSVGGIAGINRGLIARCSFTGTVTGKNMVGGIAGENRPTGGLLECRTVGSVLGGAMVGGVAGNNTGSILSCRNESYVNTESTDPKLNISDLNITEILKNFNILSSDTAGVVQDSGGIAGYNSGIIGLSENAATVGYQHTGYNAGGIAGRSCGYLYSCENTGEVFGRKDVGGIAGQMEPYVFSETQTDLLANLNSQYRSLTWLLDEAAEDAAQYGDQAAARYHSIANQLQPVAEAFRNADAYDADSMENLLGSVSGAIGQASGSLHGIGSNLTAAGATLTEDMEAINSQIGAISSATSGVIHAITNPDLSSIITDTSDEKIDELTYGKITDCENTGSIEGDRDVGGIIGQISVEDSGNPEDDLSLNLGSTLRTEYEYKAVLVSCTNRGQITARKDYAGSICGMSSLGFITGCHGYGTVESQNGNCVGGISGLNMTKITDCWTKCLLSGEKYVGGITGCGSSEGDSPSLVSGCVSFSQIGQAQQFCGAISGYAAGDYSGNLFISDSLQGIDGLNITGAAEPASYEELLENSDFPDDCRRFTVTFLADDEIIKAISVDFGVSVDAAQFPAVPKKEGFRGVWNADSLESIVGDTRVEAEYRRLDTILPSNLTRASNRAALYAEGLFDEEDVFLVSSEPVDPNQYPQINGSWLHQIGEQLNALTAGETVDATVCRDQIEHLTLSIPDDGEEAHIIRYTPPEQLNVGGVRIYLETPEGLEKLAVTSIGKYDTFAVHGSTASLVVFSTVRTGWMILICAAGILAVCAVIFLIICLVRRRYLKKIGRKVIQNVGKQAENLPKEKKITLLVSLTVGTVFLIAAVMLFRSTPLWASLRTGKEIRNLVKTEDQTYSVSVCAESGNQAYSFDGSFCKRKDSGIAVMTAGDISVYYHESRVYLENGSAYAVSDKLPDRSELLPVILKACLDGKPGKTVSGSSAAYTLSLGTDTANTLMNLLLPEAAGRSTSWELTEASALLEAEDARLVRITLSCSGETHSGAAVSARCILVPEETLPEIPGAVSDAIAQNAEPSGTLTPELLTLAESWVKFRMEPELSGTLSLSANCGTLVLNDQLEYAHTLADGTPIHMLTRNRNTVYFTDRSICTADGKELPADWTAFADASRLIPLLEEISLHSSLRSQTFEDVTRIVLQVSAEDAAQLSKLIVGSDRVLNLEPTGGSLTITLRDSKLQNLSLYCSGTLTVVRTQIPADIRAGLTLEGAHKPVTIPEAVRNTLIIPEA